MNKLLPLLCAGAALVLAGCGEKASTGSTKDQGLVKGSGLEASQGVKGPGKVDASGGGEAGDAGGGTNRTRKDGTAISGGTGGSASR